MRKSGLHRLWRGLGVWGACVVSAGLWEDDLGHFCVDSIWSYGYDMYDLNTDDVGVAGYSPASNKRGGGGEKGGGGGEGGFAPSSVQIRLL